jgi:hypothetical protein
VSSPAPGPLAPLHLPCAAWGISGLLELNHCLQPRLPHLVLPASFSASCRHLALLVSLLKVPRFEIKYVNICIHVHTDICTPLCLSLLLIFCFPSPNIPVHKDREFVLFFFFFFLIICFETTSCYVALAGFELAILLS